MSIQQSLIRVCTQTAVYWGAPKNDGFGSFTYDDPIELTPPNGVRWEDRISITGKLMDKMGDIFSCNAVVYVQQDVDEEGYMFLGTLNDLDSDQAADPTLVSGAYRIKRFDKIPAMRSDTEFTRKAFLGLER
jgi:hypothetical protein